MKVLRLFKKFGKVVRVTVRKKPDDGNLYKSWAFVTFEESRAVAAAMRGTVRIADYDCSLQVQPAVRRSLIFTARRMALFAECLTAHLLLNVTGSEHGARKRSRRGCFEANVGGAAEQGVLSAVVVHTQNLVRFYQNLVEFGSVQSIAWGGTTT
jgi:hypothetical protein